MNTLAARFRWSAGWQTLQVAFGVLALVPIIGAVAASPTYAQDNITSNTADINNKHVSLNLDNADIRYALKLLFDSVGANYTLDPSVQGNVTVKLNDVPFRVALESTLRGAGSATPLTYRVENGVYNIAPRVETPTTTQPPTTETTPTTQRRLPTKIFLQFADAIDIARNLGGGVIVSRLSNMGGMGGMGGGMGMGGMMGGMGGGLGGTMGGFGGGMGGFGGGMGGMGGGMGGFGGGGVGGFGGGGFGGGGFGGGRGGGGFGR